MLDVSIRYAPGMRECYLEARVSLVRVVVLPAPLLAVQQYALAIMSQLEAVTAATTDSADSMQSCDSSAAANSDNAVTQASVTTTAGDHFTVSSYCMTANVLAYLVCPCVENCDMQLLSCYNVWLQQHAACISLVLYANNVPCYLYYACHLATVPALPPLQVCISVALVQCELWLPENPNGSIHCRDQVNNYIYNIIDII
jgi:hypothetical protein